MSSTCLDRLRTLALVCLFFATLSPGAPRAKEDHDAMHGDTDAAEMGILSAEIGATWKAADPELKAAFTREYMASRDERAVFAKYLESLGAPAMLDYLELENPRCHGSAHALGKALFAQRKDVGAALAICGNHCTNACMHGVVGEAFGGHDFDAVTDEMAGLCQNQEMERLHKPGNCAHGIGHALMISTEHDIAQSLGGCKRFDEPGMEYYCATGVFMEYRDLLRVRAKSGNKIARPSRHHPCDTHTDYPAACYRYMLRVIRSEIGVSRDQLIQECLGLDQPLQRGCFHGLGAMYSRRIADDPLLLPRLCLNGSREDRILCIEGAIEKLAEFSDERAKVVCATLEGENAEICKAGAKEKMYRLDKPTLELYRP